MMFPEEENKMKSTVEIVILDHITALELTLASYGMDNDVTWEQYSHAYHELQGLYPELEELRRKK